MTSKFRKQVDWSAIEPDWRAGILTPSELSEKHGVSRAAMNKHFGKLGIERDLVEQIRETGQKKLIEHVAAAEVEAVVKRTPTPATVARLEHEAPAIVDKEGEVHAVALRRHHATITRAWRIVDMLLHELEHQSEHIELYEQLGDLMYKPDDKGVDKLNMIYQKAMSLPSRSTTMKTLLDSLKLAIGLERENLGITDRTPGSNDDPIALLVRSLQGTALKPVTTIEATRYAEVDE